jgi:hypothetical protein
MRTTLSRFIALGRDTPAEKGNAIACAVDTALAGMQGEPQSVEVSIMRAFRTGSL